MAGYQDFVNWEIQQGLLPAQGGYDPWGYDPWNQQGNNPWNQGSRSGGSFFGLTTLIVMCVLLPIAFVGVFTGFQWPQKKKE